MYRYHRHRNFLSGGRKVGGGGGSLWNKLAKKLESANPMSNMVDPLAARMGCKQTGPAAAKALHAPDSGKGTQFSNMGANVPMSSAHKVVTGSGYYFKKGRK